MKNKKNPKWLNNEEGNTLVLVVVLLLCMTLLGSATVTLARTQWNMARFSRQTSNSYYLARSGAEKIVDSMNKEIAAELPRLMEEASFYTHNKMLDKSSSEDGISYKLETDASKAINPYSGKYTVRDNKNEYEAKLKELIYDHIVNNFNGSISYKAYSDVKGNEPIEITTKLYHKASTGVAGMVPEDIKNIVENLAKDTFAVEVIALAKKGSKTSLTKSRVIGTIALDQILSNKEQLLEEYTWAVDEHGIGIYPEALQSAIISFGDLIIKGDYSATVQGDIHVKGTQRKTTDTEYINGNFPEPDESGGVTISDGGQLKIEGNAYVVSNIQTVNSYGNENLNTKITIEKDAIANTIGIHDSYYTGHPYNIAPWKNYSKNNKIHIGQNVYMDNDIRIDRYVDGGEIKVTGSVFGVSDKDPNGRAINIGGSTKIAVDPNKSSGIFSLGKSSKITVGRAFVAGQPFINFGDGNGYHRLYESIGEPFEDVYYLEKYREHLGEDNQYITDLKDLINKEKIKIVDKNGANPYGFAPAYVSSTVGISTLGESYNVETGVYPITDPTIAQKTFYLGGGYFPTGWESALAKNSDWNENMLGTNKKWSSVIVDPEEFYKGNNSFNKVFIPDSSYSDGTTFNYNLMTGYKGLQAYMLAKRGVFYSQFIQTSATTKYEPAERSFNDLIDMSVFIDSQQWSYNNPIYVVDESATIDISQFDSIPTAIICNNENSTIRLKASNPSKAVFNGVVISPGKIKIISKIEINGVMIAGNESDGIGITREKVQKGDYAGVQISATNVKIKYDRDMILKIRFLDKTLQRKLYDCLKITNYQSSLTASNEQSRINIIMGEPDKRKIKLSKSSVISSEQGGLHFVMKTLKKL